MLPALVTIGLMWSCGAFIVIRAMMGAHKHPTGRRSAVPYMPSSNPFRIGSTVIINEGGAYNWGGVVMSTSGDFMNVRDNCAPYDVITVYKDHVFPGGTVF